MSARYAIYFIPEPRTPLAERGSALLGRDSETGKEIPQAHLPGVACEKLRGLTTNARHYGLHATLKAPFFLKPGLTEQELLYVAARFVLGRKVLTLPRLAVTRIGSFFAMTPARETPEEQKAVMELHTLAADAVSFFDSFRAAPSEQETARRKPHNLSARQRELLFAWGYPYVFDEYRFHITLTDAVPDSADMCVMEKGLRECFSVAGSCPVDVTGICVCRQNVSGSSPHAFTLLRRFPMADSGFVKL